MKNTNLRNTLVLAGAIFLVPSLMGADGCKDSAVFSREPAPSVQGAWDVTYEDDLAVQVTIGGAVYEQTIGAQGGAIEVTHNGNPFTFDLDCTKPEVVCPSETWPMSVTMSQRRAQFPHRMFVEIPRQVCSGPMVAAEPSACGAGTANPDCDQVCMGTLSVQSTDHFGVINNEGDAFDVLLGAGVATNGINCGLLGVSSVHGDLITTGSVEEENWEATGIANGTVVAAYTGGCLWAGDANMDGELEALVIGASVKFTTGYAAQRQ